MYHHEFIIALLFDLVLLTRTRVMSSSLQLNNANKTPSSSTRQVINPNPGVHLLCRKKKKKYEKVVEHCNLMSTKLAPRQSRACTVLWNCGASTGAFTHHIGTNHCGANTALYKCRFPDPIFEHVICIGLLFLHQQRIKFKKLKFHKS